MPTKYKLVGGPMHGEIVAMSTPTPIYECAAWMSEFGAMRRVTYRRAAGATYEYMATAKPRVAITVTE